MLERVLTNVTPPPNLFVNQIADGYTNGLSSVRIKPLVYKLVQKFDIRLRQV